MLDSTDGTTGFSVSHRVTVLGGCVGAEGDAQLALLRSL